MVIKFKANEFKFKIQSYKDYLLPEEDHKDNKNYLRVCPGLPEVKEELRLDGLEEGLEEDAQAQDTLTSEKKQRWRTKYFVQKESGTLTP